MVCQKESELWKAPPSLQRFRLVPLLCRSTSWSLTRFRRRAAPPPSSARSPSSSTTTTTTSSSRNTATWWWRPAGVCEPLCRVRPRSETSSEACDVGRQRSVNSSQQKLLPSFYRPDFFVSQKYKCYFKTSKLRKTFSIRTATVLSGEI